ncbi:MAG TPA: XTP/dITP diphosphatase [bacterium]|nr:XTP/dITP diphosphatase [bacterium]
MNSRHEARVILATRNRHKIEELLRLLNVPGIVFEDLRSWPPLPEVEEDGATYEENAIKKAREIADATGLPALADDSGLDVDALGGAPGLHSARYAGQGASDAANRAKLLQAMAAVPDERRTARFRCVIAIAIPDGSAMTVQGSCEGTILREERGSGGFGYDPLFLPEGERETFAEMSDAQKDALSHRGVAVRRAAEVLAGLVLDTPSTGP